MTLPVLTATINFSTGPSFAQALLLDSGQLDVNILADAVSVIVDVSDVIDKISYTRGRNITADQFQTGQLSLRILDTLGNFNPQNILGPYYSLLSPMRKLTITATYSSITYDLFAGYITGYQTTTPTNAIDTLTYTTITAVDAFRLFNLATVTNIAGAAANDLSGTRINQILDAISWPSSMRDIDAGLTTLQMDPGTSRSALSAMATVETTEYGALYTGANGSIVFQDRQVTSTSVNNPPTVFASDGSGITYQDVKFNLSDILVYNQANVTATGLALQTALNQDSIDLYFLHTYTATGLLMQDTATALNYAQSYVASRAATSIRVDQLTLNLYTENYNTGIIAALDLDFFDPVTIQADQPGNTSITKTVQIFGVSMDITVNSWIVNFVTMEPVIDAFQLDYSELDDAQSILSY